MESAGAYLVAALPQGWHTALPRPLAGKQQSHWAVAFTGKHISVDLASAFLVPVFCSLVTAKQSFIGVTVLPGKDAKGQPVQQGTPGPSFSSDSVTPARSWFLPEKWK